MPEPLHVCDICLGVPWGEPWEIGSAAFWGGLAEQTSTSDLAIGHDLREEVAACLLGGYRVAGPVGVAAFALLRDRGLLAASTVPSEQALFNALSDPLRDASGPLGRYPFPRQRARRLAAALQVLHAWHEQGWRAQESDAAFRDRLCSLPGVGPKTASWIVRNVRNSDAVAIIDVHVLRAGLAAGVFCPGWRLPSDYGRYEEAFLHWACRAGVRAAALDTAIWRALTGGRRSVLVQPPAAIIESTARWAASHRIQRPGAGRTEARSAAALIAGE